MYHLCWGSFRATEMKRGGWDMARDAAAELDRNLRRAALYEFKRSRGAAAESLTPNQRFYERRVEDAAAARAALQGSSPLAPEHAQPSKDQTLASMPR